MESVDIKDLKSFDPKGSCGFESRLGHKRIHLLSLKAPIKKKQFLRCCKRVNEHPR